MLFSSKIDTICFQNLGRFGSRLANFYTDMSQSRVFSHRLKWYCASFLLLFFYDPITSWPLTQPKTSACPLPEFKFGALDICRYLAFFGRFSSGYIAFLEFFDGWETFALTVRRLPKAPQVSSVQPITKLSRLIIDDPRSTVILLRCNRTDRRYRP